MMINRSFPYRIFQTEASDSNVIKVLKTRTTIKLGCRFRLFVERKIIRSIIYNKTSNKCQT